MRIYNPVISGSILISGSGIVSGTWTVTGGITGSLFGTASWSLNSISSSRALTASFYQEVDPIFTNLSASLATTGSNIFRGNQTITGSINASGSVSVVGPITATNFTGSLFGTSSWSVNSISASRALTASFYQETDPIFTNLSASLATTGSNIFRGNQTITGSANISGSLILTGSLSVNVGSQDELIVSATGLKIGNVISDTHFVTGTLLVSGSITGSLFGTSSWSVNSISSSRALTASFYQETDPIFSSLSASLATTGSNIFRGNQTVTGSVNISGSLTVVGPVTATNFTGSLFGTSSWALNAISASNGGVTQIVAGTNVTISPASGLGVVTINSTGGGGGGGFPFTGSAIITGSLVVTGSITATDGITGSLFGTSSWALNAISASNGGVTRIIAGTNITISPGSGLGDVTINSTGGGGSGSVFPFTGSAVITGSLVVTGSFAVNNGTPDQLVISSTGVKIGNASTDIHFITGTLLVSGSITGTLNGTASWGTDPEYRRLSASYATTGSNTFRGNQTITGSLIISGTILRLTGSLSVDIGTQNELAVSATGIKIGSVISDIHSVTGSLIVSGSITGSLFGTSSWSQNSITASHALTASYVLSASNGGVTRIIAGTNITISPGSGLGDVTINSTGGGGGSGSTFPFTGSAVITGSLILTGSANITGNVSASTVYISGSGTQQLIVIGSGSAQPIILIQGSQGELFSITDSLSGSLFVVSDASGLPVLEAFSDGRVLMGSYLAPSLNTTNLIPVSSTSSINLIASIPTASYDGVFIDYTVRLNNSVRVGTFMATWSGSLTQYTDYSTLDFGNTSGVTFAAFISGSNLVVTGSTSTPNWKIKSIIRGI